MTDRSPEPGASWHPRPVIATVVAVVLAEFAFSGWAWGQIAAGAQIPIHWGMDGRPNGWAPKEIGLLAVPLLTAGIGVLLALVPRFEPRRSNLFRSATAYRAVSIGIVVLLGALHGVTVLAATGATIEIGRAVVFGTGVLFAVIGNYLPKVRSNFLFGIRTPWTLASDLAWDRTHRLLGRLWVLFGLALGALAVLGVGGELMAGTMLVGIALTLVLGVVYSYRVWRADPNRQEIGR